jgi:hypothetical protein
MSVSIFSGNYVKAVKAKLANGKETTKNLSVCHQERRYSIFVQKPEKSVYVGVYDWLPYER